ncbi:MAG: S8 family serine peptidase, partial [Bryobacteraceae bacterium]
ASVEVGGATYRALPGDSINPSEPLTAPLFDTATIGDTTGLACRAFTRNTLAGRIALIQRGTCNFSVKLTNALAGGAVGVIFYTAESDPEPFAFGAGGVALPAVMINNADGVELKQRLLLPTPLDATLTFNLIVAADPNVLASFSSRGPNPDTGIKPDLLATGVNVFTAFPTQPATYGQNYGLNEGTSFSSPLVAGAAATLRAFRPGLSAAHYRSLLINTAAPFGADGIVVPVQRAGA